MTNNSTKNEEEDKDEEASFSEIYSDSDADSDDDERWVGSGNNCWCITVYITATLMSTVKDEICF